MTDLILDASLYANSTDFEDDFDPSPDQIFTWVGQPLQVVSGKFKSGNPSSGLIVNATPVDNNVFAEFTHGSAFDADGHCLWLLDSSGDGYATRIGYTTRLYNVTAYALGSQIEVYPSSTAPVEGDVHRMAVAGTDLIVTKNDVEVVTITVTSVPRKGGMLLQLENSGNTTIGQFKAGVYSTASPAINPTGTDTDLVNGSSASMVFTGLTSNPVSIEVVWDNGVDTPITTTQSGFSLGTVTDGGATATYTPTIGNLPYSDATYDTGDYSFLVTCADDSEITLDTLTFSPEAGNEFITLASPVNDETSVIPSETLATGMQIEWPTIVLGDTVTINADATWEVDFDGEPQELVFDLGYWNLTTRSVIETTLTIDDTVPETFVFTPVTDAELSTVTTSNSITVEGIDASADISIDVGEYRVNAGSWTSSAGTVDVDDEVEVRITSSGSYSTEVVATLTIGTVEGEFSVTTIDEPADTIPDAFEFTAVTDVELNTSTESEEITVEGINTSTAISIVNGEYNVNDGGWTSSSGTVELDDLVKVRRNSSTSYETEVTTTLTIGGVSAIFSVTTAAQDSVNPFTFPARYNTALESVYTSNEVTITGILSDRDISIVGGEYSINGGGFTSDAGTVSLNDTVRVRLTTSASYSTVTTATLTVDDYVTSFSATTSPEVSGGGSGFKTVYISIGVGVGL